MKLASIFLFLAFWLLPICVFPHDGHGILPDGILHYLTSPEHLVLIAMLLLVSAYVLIKKRIKKNRNA